MALTKVACGAGIIVYLCEGDRAAYEVRRLSIPSLTLPPPRKLRHTVLSLPPSSRLILNSVNLTSTIEYTFKVTTRQSLPFAVELLE